MIPRGFLKRKGQVQKGAADKSLAILVELVGHLTYRCGNYLAEQINV